MENNPSEIQVNYYPLDITPSSSNSKTSTPEDPQVNTSSIQQENTNLVPTGGGTVMSNGTLKSSNYVADVAGWLLDSNGKIYGVAIITQGGRIANWYINTNTIASGATEATSNVLIDSLNSLIRLGPLADKYILLDGLNQVIKSSNYSAGLDGFSISPTLIEAQNLKARGLLQGATFQYDVISCVGGQLLVANADVLDVDLNHGDTTITTKGSSTFATYDILVTRALASTGIEEESFRVIDASSAPTYRVSRDYAVNFATGKSNLQGFWRFDENTGVSARDSSANLNHGVITNATFVNGRYGTALNFNGTNTDVTITSAASLNPSTAITLTFWIYNPGSVAFTDIIHKQDFSAKKGYSVTIDSNNQISFQLGDGSAFTTAFGGNNSVPINTWTHFVCTWTSGGVLTIYKNGVQLTTSSSFAGPILYSAGNLAIGKNSFAGIEYFNGYLDEVRIYNVGFISSQAVTMYTGETPLFYKGCTIAKQGFSDSISTFGGGYLRLIGEGTNSPFYSVFNRTGIKATDVAEVCRFGNLNGIGGFVSDTYGIFLGNKSSGKFLSFDSVSGNLNINNYIQTSIGAFGGDGSDGILSISSGTTTIDLAGAAVFIKNYSSISITGTAKLAFINPHANGTDVIFKCNGNVVITSSTVPCIELSSLGGAGGAGATGTTVNGTDGNVGIGNLFTAGLGGGGVKSPTNTGGTAGAAVPSYSGRFFKVVNLFPGGGGGGGATGSGTAGSGGIGGGALYLECKGSLNFAGTINANGGNGGNGTNGAGGGGGGGGTVVILYNFLTANTGTINTTGGTGGSNSGANVGGSGGGGGSATVGATGGASNQPGGNGGNGYSIVAMNNSFA